MSVRITILAATIAWAIGEALMRRSLSSDRIARASWTLGIALALVHVALAFHVVYGWDHDAAVVATARQTGDTVGLRWGGGIYVNFVFLLVWLADVCWWWIARAAHASRSLRFERVRLAVFVFMFINGAVLFASGVGRLVGILSIAIVVLASLTPNRQVVTA